MVQLFLRWYSWTTACETFQLHIRDKKGLEGIYYIVYCEWVTCWSASQAVPKNITTSYIQYILIEVTRLGTILNSLRQSLCV